MYTAVACRNIKVVLVGDMTVGKTSLANVFVNRTFKEKYVTTVGGHFMARTLDNPKVTVQIWDTAGTERFRSMLPTFMRDALCALIVYDVSNKDSFDSVRDYWLDYVEAAVTQKLVKVLVGNKMDVSDRTVKRSDGQRLADHHGMMFIETSAKFELNVDKLFADAATQVIATIPETVEKSSGIRLEQMQTKKSGCCLPF